ncbi:ADP-ribosylglycohydrolase family protein [Pararhodospirillum oryzae]|uniref:ADP-ribosylglycohydrolase n=1 Tax=Pararhodospirillum oryzae TaxID=478448 RepID=A0A512HAT6_9PROT|nr:ADP-ribosylglycohydrolase family protein [Pararhodospirillum oryzae]GEO82573.1 hypothetical protein ROR02_27040 [Pararhodospirillum oryzae]
MTPVPPLPDRFRGCLLACAIGDALGAPIEFLSLPHIRDRFGARGVRDFVTSADGLGSFTDDTQMTLFTADGLIRAAAPPAHDPLPFLHRAYVRWLATQREAGAPDIAPDLPGWLGLHPALQARRAPGATCLGALHAHRPGSTEAPLNNSKGCGGVMRVAPIGLACTDPSRAFGLGCAAAALTHGHPSGYLTAGVLAALISVLTQGESLDQALEHARALLRPHAGAEETLAALEAAQTLAQAGPPSPEALETLGEGWVAEEALGIAVYAVLATTTLEEALVLAVNHGGDSDSTGAIAGALVGTRDGTAAMPIRWVSRLEAQDLIEQVADDLYQATRHGTVDLERYPTDQERARFPDTGAPT